MQSAPAEAIDGVPAGDLAIKQEGGEESVPKKKKKKKKKKKPTETDTGEELPSNVDVTETRENGDKNPGLSCSFMLYTDYLLSVILCNRLL